MSIYVVTGGAGFIGSHLADAVLRAGHQVRIVDDLSTGKAEQVDPAADFIQGDVADRKLMGEVMEGAAGVFHLAASAASRQDWCDAHRTNQAGTIAVLDAARAAGGIPVCYASSAAVYGEQGARAIQEGARPRPLTALGADKLGSELHAAVAFSAHGVPTLGFRLFNVYGPRQDPHAPDAGVVAILAARILAGSVITLHGDGRQSRDFVHVADVVKHLFAGMQMLRREPQAMVLNLCTGRATSIRTLADTLGVAAARVPMIQQGKPRPGDLRTVLGDPNEAIHVLGVEAGIDLETGLRSLLPAPAPAATAWTRAMSPSRPDFSPTPRAARAPAGPLQAS